MTSIFNEVKKEINWGGKTLSIETGKVARQANGSVIVSMGKAKILAAVTISQGDENYNFLPLTVHFLEKHYAAGRIPSGFFKREAKPSEAAVLTSRLIDRSIRPSFPKSFCDEVNVICTVLSYDADCHLDMLALIAASAALAISDAPVEATVAGIRVGFINGEYVINPSNEQLTSSDLDLVIAGDKDSVYMVESEAKEASEEKMLEALEFAHNSIKPVIELIEDLKGDAGKKKLEIVINDNQELINQVKEKFLSEIEDSYTIKEKQDRAKSLKNLKEKISTEFTTEEVSAKDVSAAFSKVEREVVRSKILSTSERIDGRKVNEIRPIEIEVGLLPSAHGSALFTRGETQALVITTVGSSSRDEQIIDSISSPASKETFMLHYNFPPYSVGEVGQLKPPGRREIGHGKLAWKSVNPVIPSYDEFGYVTRVVSEITESNGSSSMATVCGTSLSLMDAGIPIKKPVSGIAMGLIKEGNKYAVLSDIMGDEDHLGDMDFKVAGTSEGITSLQMDIKIRGVSAEIMTKALLQAKDGRTHILGEMAKVISEPRKDLNDNIPKVKSITIPVKKIKDVIGAKGKTIRNICDKTGAQVDVDNKGIVKITSNSSVAIKEAIKMIADISFEPEVGTIYEGPVVSIIDAGAFVNIYENKDGFVHISELAESRVDYVEDVINEGDIIKVKVIGTDKKGRPKLSYRSVDQITGEDLDKSNNSSHSPSGNKEEKKKRRFF